ncbi:Holliday junction branch migration protein RuvA [Gilvimarinus sp. F26214L]|uniref:Holliday junction branch migration protein RuvA n=1 Tax=Gilvimarinus sp. DZF01 TaxID=3461371 RepID=UPI004045C679
MIGRLRGILVEKHPPDLLLDVNGVFYEVQVPMTSIYRLPEVDTEITLHTHFAVNETAQQLFGFADKRDRELFRALIRVNGVGPKLGLSILSGMEADDIVHHVREDNPAALVKVPGIGKKTAERLIIELRDRLKDWGGQLPASAKTAVDVPAAPAAPDERAIVAEAESALIALGYKPAQAAQIVVSVQKEHQLDRSDELIRMALRSLATA